MVSWLPLQIDPPTICFEEKSETERERAVETVEERVERRRRKKKREERGERRVDTCGGAHRVVPCRWEHDLGHAGIAFGCGVQRGQDGLFGLVRRLTGETLAA